jgi:hypothetical protein
LSSSSSARVEVVVVVTGAAHRLLAPLPRATAWTVGGSGQGGRVVEETGSSWSSSTGSKFPCPAAATDGEFGCHASHRLKGDRSGTICSRTDIS